MPPEQAEHQELLRSLSAIGRIRELLYGRSALVLAVPAISGGTEWSEARKSYLAKVEEAVAVAGLEWTTWKPLVEHHVIKSRRDWQSLGKPLLKRPRRGPPKRRSPTGRSLELQVMLRRQFDGVQAALKNIPPSLQKAHSAIAFLLETCPALENSEEADTCFPDLLAAINSEDLPCSGTYKSRLREQLTRGDVPTGPTYWEDEWATAWIRYAERHALHHCRKLIRETSEEFEQGLREGLLTLWPNQTPRVPCHNLLSQLRRCWAASHSLRIRVRVTPIAADVLRVALTWQDLGGGWTNAWDGERSTGLCSDTTALSVYCLLRYRDHDEWTDAIERGIRWLLENPNADGGWGRTNVRGATEKINICATVAALDAMRLFGTPADHPVVQRAEAALLAAQHPTGTWMDCRGQAEDFLTPLVVRYFQRRGQRPLNMQEPTLLGRGLMLRGHSLSQGQTTTDRILALVSLFHGLEYVLYGFLIEDGSVSIRKNGAETIGLRVALHEFESIAKRRGWIGPTARLPHKTQLEELAARRDEVIHRMATIQAPRLELYVESAFGFVDQFDVKVLGYSLLD